MYPLKQAMSNATVTLNAPKFNVVTLMVSKVMVISISSTRTNTLYSVVCDVLFAIIGVFKVMKSDTSTGTGKSKLNPQGASKVRRFP